MDQKFFAPGVPAKVIRSQSGRLRAVAEIIRRRPSLYNQGSFLTNDEDLEMDGPITVVGGRHPCGTACCIAGWGVILSPPSLLRGEVDRDNYAGWNSAGAMAYGFDQDLALAVFDAYFTRENLRKHRSIPVFLDALADLPSPKRTWDHVHNVLEWL